MDPAWITAATALALAAGGVLLWAARQMWRMGARIHDFLDDWAGQPARAGVAARPGVMERLHGVEGRLDQVIAETRPDHGHSLRDVVHRTADAVDDIAKEQADVRRQLDLLDSAQRKDQP